MASTKKAVKAAPRRAVDAGLSAAISENVAPLPTRGAVSAKPFEKLSISVASDVAHDLRVAAIVEHRVSESALIETALRRFLELPKADRTTALQGQGRRRRAG